MRIKNRERKFRAYDLITNLKVTDPYCFFMSLDNDGTLNIMNNILVCDCIGKNDKNGTPVYERDILKVTYNRDTSGKDVVTYYMEVTFDIHKDHCGFDIPDGDFEVVGNAIENKDLLNLIE